MGAQISFGRGCVHTGCGSVVSSLLIWESVSIPHTGMYGGSVLFFFPSTQLFRLMLYLTSVCSQNLTPSPPSSKTHVGQEKLCYCTHKSDVYCLYSDNTRSHYQCCYHTCFANTEWKVLQSTVICYQCLLLTMMQGLEKLDETLYIHCILGCFLSLPRMCTRWRNCDGSTVMLCFGLRCQPAAAKGMTLVCS